MTELRYTCPCCGYRTFDEFPGSDNICHVCFWHDDAVQILDPWFDGGANDPSLVEAQGNYARFGATEQRLIPHVKGVLPGDERDPRWRRAMEADRAHIRTPRDLSQNEHRDLKIWYYWLHAA